MDDQAVSDIAAYANRISAVGRHDDVGFLASELARALSETSSAEHPAKFASRELFRLANEAREFLRGSE